MSVEDQHNLRKMKTSTILRDNHLRLEVGMLWRNKMEGLPKNYMKAIIRFQSLKRKLQRDPGLSRAYREIIDGYVTKGYARKLTEDEIKATSQRTWYLPHHPVVSTNKPGKVRVVFDAAAKKGSTCLNDLLCTGPDLSSNLIGVLLRFRKYPIAVVADIEAMFHQVWVSSSDRQCLRFLWSKDIS